MRDAARYLLASGALGAVALWASEQAFWVLPPDEPAFLPLTWLLYAGASAAALSAVLWAGVQGWPACFLGGAVLGYAVEGAVVGTTYDAFPFQLAWTALSWHALVTGGIVLALLRARMGAGRRLLGWVALGLGLAVWAQGWVVERGADLGNPRAWGWLLGLAPLLPLAGWALDRLGRLAAPRRAVLLAPPVLLAATWAALGVATLDARRLVLLPVVGGLLWLMRRLGGGGALDLRGPVRGREHLLALAAPVTAAVVAPWLGGGWALAHLVVAVLLTVAALGVLGVLVRRSSRAPRRGGGP